MSKILNQFKESSATTGINAHFESAIEGNGVGTTGVPDRFGGTHFQFEADHYQSYGNRSREYQLGTSNSSGYRGSAKKCKYLTLKQ
jgi:hypothetical protein